MGLDMYLNKKTYIGANYEHNNVTGTIRLKKGDTPIKIKLNRVSGIEEQVGYWRKFNALHNWFVSNIQGGVDECQQSYVSPQKLQELLTTLEELVKNKGKAADLLPTTDGFFFGGTEYDEYYWKNVKDTIKILKECIKEPGDYYYQASW